MIEAMTQPTGEPIPGAAPIEAARPPMAPLTPKAPDANAIAANNTLAGEIKADLSANPPRIDAALADAAGVDEASLPAETPPSSQEQAKIQGLSPEEIQELGTSAAVFIRDHPLPEQAGMFQETTYTQDDLMVARRDSLPVELGQRFDAHGIAKGGYKDQLAALNSLLTDGIDPTREFHTVPLKHSQEIEAAGAMGAAGPYDTGNFIALGNPDSSIRDGGIGAVLVNEAFYDAIPRLQEAYPGVKFIRADQMTEGLSEMLKPATSPEPSTEAGTPAPASEPSEAITSETTSPSEAGPTEHQTTEPAQQPTDPTPPNAPIEDSTSTDSLSEDQLAEMVADIAEGSKSQNGFSFGLGEKARKVLAEAEAKGKLSVADRKALEDEIGRADYQEALLLTNVGVVTSKQNFEGQKSTPEEVAKAGQAVREAIAKRKEAYGEMFKGIKKSAKATHREYGDVLSDLKSDARSQMDTYESAYEAAQESGDAQTIADAKIRFEAAREHYLMINKEKRKELLKGFLKALGLSAVTTLISDSTKQVKGGAMGPQRH